MLTDILQLMKAQLLYRDFARYYDLLYSFKDYEKESRKVIMLIKKYKKSDGNELLEVACGTGKHLESFRKHFKSMGIDMNKGILDVARQRLKDVDFKKANMVDMNLGKQFDVITCLFSSIGYVKTYKNLQKTLDSFSSHLKPGGVVIIEPWFTKESYNVDTPHMATYDSPEIKIARLNVSSANGNISIMEMHYLVAEKGKEVTYFKDRHELGMFGIDKTLEFMKQSGLRTKYLKNGLMKDRGLLIGVKS